MTVGKYQLLRKLASGGMAEVYLAKAAGPQGFEKTLVVKRVLPHLAEDPTFVEMFFSEARLAALLNHPNVVQIFDFGESEGAYFLAMEYIDGLNLRTLCKRAHAAGMLLPVQLCAKLLSHVCEGLAYAHTFVDPGTGEPLRLVHRDISPDNILVSAHGAVKVVDFGIAKAANQLHRTRTGIVKGKIAYMPPEQIQNKPLDARADIFALGVVLYELLSGQKPFEATSEVGMMQAILYQPPVPVGERRADVPETVRNILGRALAKERDERYGSCRELQADLERYLHTAGEPVGAWHIAQLVAQFASPQAAAPRRVPEPVSPPREAEEDSLVVPPSRELQPTRASSPRSVASAESADSAPTWVTPPPRDTQALPRMESTAPVTQVARRMEPADSPPAERPPRRTWRGGRWPLAAAGLLVAALGTFVMARPEASSAEPLATEHRPPAPVPPPAQVMPSPAEPPAVSTPQPAQDDTPALALVQPAVAEPSAPAAEVPPQRAEPQKASVHGRTRTASAGATVALASFRVTSSVPGMVRVNGRSVGRTPAQVRGIPLGKVDVEVFDAQTGFSKKQTFDVKAGDNGVFPFDIRKGRLTVRVFPYATVMIDGKSLGQTPLAPVELYEGRHVLQLTNAELNKELQVEYVVRAGGDHVYKANLQE
jgi:serine/threonine-protein kinase